jgi:hypothetical protein
MLLGHPDQDIFHKNREISILMMKKKPTARLTLLQEATERSKLGKTKTNKKQKNKKQQYGQKCPVDRPVSFLFNIYDPSCTNYLV